MKLFIVLLLASLATTSLAVLHEQEDEIHLETQTTDDSAPFAPISHPRKDSISSEDLSTEPFILREELISQANVGIKSTRPNSQKSEVPHAILQEDSSKSAGHQLEETAESIPTAATTLEGKLNKFGYKMKTDLKKVVKGISDYLKDLIPSSSDVMKP